MNGNNFIPQFLQFLGILGPELNKNDGLGTLIPKCASSLENAFGGGSSISKFVGVGRSGDAVDENRTKVAARARDCCAGCV